MKKVILSLLCVISLATVATTVALADDQSQYKKLKLSEGRKTYKSLDLPKDSVTKFSRLTWSTNMVEWLLFAPNFGVEFDLKDPTLISCPSIFLQFSYRPGKEDFMKHENYSTNALYYWRARAEYRWHFRLNERREQRRGLGKTAMWVDEKIFTKKAVDVVVDTTIVLEGGGYGTREVMSKEKRVQEKIDSTCNATNQKKPELFPGRYYLGVYGEYDNVTFNNRMIPIFGKNLKNGPVYQVGLSGGYDFPGFNYNHKCFLQWSVGASLGVFWYNYDEYVPGQASKDNPTCKDQSKILPFITELKVALNFRNSTITNKYWKPDPSVYTDNIRRNHEDSIHMAELDTILAEKPVIINVTSVNGLDSAFVENVDKFAIVQAFRNATGLTYLMPNDFNMLTHTELALNNKELSDNYFIEYVTTNRLRNYTDSVFVSDRKNLPFRVQIAGREEADSLKNSFVDSLKNYYANHDNTRPVFYGTPASKDSMIGFISKDSIAAKFSSIWGHQLDTSMIRTLYTGREESNDDGTTTTYYDSIITEQNINRREIYAMFIQFHPQVTLSGEDEGVGRFQVLMAGADNANDQYNRVAGFINKVARSGISLNIQRPWDGRRDNSFDKRVTREEVFALLQSYGMDSVDIKHVSISDSIYAYTKGGADLEPENITFDFGVTENKLSLPFNVVDSVGRAQAVSLFNDTIRIWKDERYWVPNQGLYDDNPKVPGYYDSTEGKWLVSVDKFIESVNDITFAHIKPYQVDTLVWRVQANPLKTGSFAGKYLAQARMIFHREWLASNGGLYYTNIPYLIVPVETKEEAGIMEPKPINYDSLYSVARDSVVYSYDSLGNVIDSTIIHIEAKNLMSAGRDSVAYTYDSLGNVIDSTIIHIEPVALEVAKDSVVAEVVSADTVKIMTVAEATAASKEAAAAAKTAAAEAKAAASEAKKAAAAAKKAQKAAASAIKKAEKSVNIPDSVVVTSDSIVYEKDSIGNIIDSTVVSVEHKIANEFDSAAQAAIATRDSIIFAEQAVADSVTQRADSLQAVADELAAKSDEAKAAAAAAKKAIAEAKAAEKEAKKRAKEEAKAAKAAAKEASKTVVSESAAATTATPVASAPTPASVSSSNTETSAAPAVRTISDEGVAASVDTVQVLTLEDATALSKSAAEAAKIAAAESKAATASAKKAAGMLKKAEKSAASAIQKAEKAVKMPEDGSEPDEATQAAIATRDSIIAVENAKVDSIRTIADSLQAVANDLAVKADEAKAAAASAKSRIAEVKAAEKARAAEAKKRAKEEAAAAKAAAKAEKEAAKAAAEETTEAVSEAAASATTEATAAVENVVATAESAAEEAVDTTGMSEKEAKAAAKKAAAEAKKKAKEEAAAKKAAEKAAKAAAKAKAKEEAAAAKAAAKAEKEAAKANAESGEENTEAKE